MRGVRHTKQGDKPEEGQAIVEFSMVIILLLLLVFGVIDFSRLFFAYATMSNGVREGARYGIVNPKDQSGIEEHARAMMVIIGGDADIDVAFPDDGDPEPDAVDPYCPHLCRIVVEARSDFDVWTPIIPGFQIVARSTMHIE